MIAMRSACLAWIALAGSAFAQGPAPAPAPAPTSPAAHVLLDQANYWRSQNRLDQADLAVKRLLLLEPDNPDALAMAAELASERGDATAARAALAKLRQINPSDQRIASVERALAVGAIDPAGLAEARSLAAQGHNAEAVARYQRLFRGNDPPGALAAEVLRHAGRHAGRMGAGACRSGTGRRREILRIRVRSSPTRGC